MSEIAGSIWWLLVTLGLLVTFHEYGHFIVARRLGVKVLRFSVGFGKPLLSRMGRDGTEYVVGAIPLGGYVKFLDDREGEVAHCDLGGEFNRKPVLSRMAITAAGPAFNLLFTVIAFWAMFVIGKGDFEPIVGRADKIAASAGFEPGDRINAIGSSEVRNWTDAGIALTSFALNRQPVDIAVTDAHGTSRTRKLDLSQLPANVDETTTLPEIGLIPQQWLIPAQIGQVVPDSPAAVAGVQPNDRILAIEDEPIRDWSDLVSAIQRNAKVDTPLQLHIERANQRSVIAVLPRAEVGKGGNREWKIGIGPLAHQANYDALLRYGPLDAIPAALTETWNMAGTSLDLLRHMLLGEAKLSNLSGPISIAQYANDAAHLGFAWFLHFLGLISLSLAIMNLLPIPILDGGHLLYYLIELVKGSPVSERTLIAGQYVGLALLVTLMGLAFYNDILRLAS